MGNWVSVKDAWNERRQKVSEWISVEDRLPEKSDYYLISNDYQSIFVSWFYTTPDYRGVKNMFIDEGVTHWMPLPSPPTSSEAK